MKKRLFPKIMIGTALVSCALTIAAGLCHRVSGSAWLLSAAITCGTIFYHFAMRLLVGTVIPNRFHYRSRWFSPKAWEAPLYRTLKVKKWKDRMPTYDPRLFSLEENTLEQIVANMCQAEIVHQVIALLSFVPLSFSLVWDSFPVFLITSVLSALLDLTFAVLQRYNRPRLVRILEKQQKKGTTYV